MLSIRKFLFLPLASFAISLSPIAYNVGVTAQAQESASVQAANEMLAWNQEYSAAYIQLVSIYNSEAMQALYAADYENLDEVVSVYSRYNAEREAILAKAARMFEALEAPERWNFQRSLFDRTERAIYQACLNAYQGIEALQANVREGSDFLPMMKLLEEGREDEAMNSLIEKQFKAARAVIESENEQLKGFLLAIPEDNPNHQFQRVMLLGNNMALVEVDLAAKGIIDVETEEMRLEHANLMEDAIKDIPKLLKIARSNQIKTNKNMNRLLKRRNISDGDKAFLNRVIGAMKTFDSTFEVEEKLLSNYRETISILRADIKDSEREALADANDLEFFELVDQRVSISTQRLQMMNP